MWGGLQPHLPGNAPLRHVIGQEGGGGGIGPLSAPLPPLMFFSVLTMHGPLNPDNKSPGYICIFIITIIIMCSPSAGGNFRGLGIESVPQYDPPPPPPNTKNIT